MAVLIRAAIQLDLEQIAIVHQECFTRQENSKVWVSATLASAPRILSYVATLDDKIIGYIFWAQKSGIRPAAVVELDQVAVLSQFQRRGIGEALIRESLALLEGYLDDAGQRVKTILVSTRDDNEAQKLYTKVLGVKVVANIENLYSSTEVFMIAKR